MSSSSEDPPVLAYKVSYPMYVLLLCPPCSQNGAPTRQPLTEVPRLTCCDRCGVQIPRGRS